MNKIFLIECACTEFKEVSKKYLDNLQFKHILLSKKKQNKQNATKLYNKYKIFAQESFGESI